MSYGTTQTNIGPCDCCEEEPDIVSGACMGSQCAEGLPQCYEVAVAGLSDDGSGCAGCSLSNGTWILKKNGNFCNWGTCSGGLTTDCRFDCDGNVCSPDWAIVSLSVVTSIGSTRTWTATISVAPDSLNCNLSTYAATYTLVESSSVSCIIAKTLSLVSESGDCTGAPATLTFDPVACT